MTERKARRSGGNRTSPQTTVNASRNPTPRHAVRVKPAQVRVWMAFLAPSAKPRRRP